MVAATFPMIPRSRCPMPAAVRAAHSVEGPASQAHQMGFCVPAISDGFTAFRSSAQSATLLRRPAPVRHANPLRRPRPTLAQPNSPAPHFISAYGLSATARAAESEERAEIVIHVESESLAPGIGKINVSQKNADAASAAAACKTAANAAADAKWAAIWAEREAKSIAAKAAAAAAAVRAARGVDPARIAVVGGGLAGLAAAYHLVHSTGRVARLRGLDLERVRVTVFDPAPPGQSAGASAAAAGLLHPFTPRGKRRAWLSARGMHATLALIAAAQPFALDGPLVRTPGLLRFALTAKQNDDFDIAARRYPGELVRHSPEAVLDMLPDPPANLSALLAKKAMVVDTPMYLRALWDACHDSGRVMWKQQRVDAFEDLFHDFDTVIICAGAGARAVSNLASLPILACKGQNLILRPRSLMGGSMASLPALPVISGKYVVPDLFRGSGTLLAGATFEYCDDREYDPRLFAAGLTPPDIDYALRELSEPLGVIAPMLLDLWEPVTVNCGVRALPPRSADGSIPMAGEITGAPTGKSAWLITGLGSRGLLHHAMLGKLVARAAISGIAEHIPPEARRVPLAFSSIAGAFDPDLAYQPGRVRTTQSRR
jgi:glycine/D-amino acid oxidase-like deaminating enzyme